MEENADVLIDRIKNSKADIKVETMPVMEEIVTVDKLPFRRYDLLGFACKLIDNNKLDEAESLLKMTQGMYENKIGSETFNRICDALYDLVLYEEMQKDEIYYQNVFKSHCKEILGNGYNLYDMKILKPKRPDAWVEYNGIIIPVEMKIGKFNKTALGQLQGYMELYKCDYGIAIGLKSSVCFPSNIKFVDLSEVKKYDN